MKTQLFHASATALAATLLLTACESTSRRTTPPPTDRTTPAGTARGVNPGNDTTDSGVPESPAAHKSKQR